MKKLDYFLIILLSTCSLLLSNNKQREDKTDISHLSDSDLRIAILEEKVIMLDREIKELKNPKPSGQQLEFDNKLNKIVLTGTLGVTSIALGTLLCYTVIALSKLVSSDRK